MKTYQFKLYPNKTEEKILEKHLNICRFTYNKLLEKIMSEKEKGNKITKNQLSSHLTLIKKEEKTNFLNACYSKMLQPNVDRLFSNIKGLITLKSNGNKTGKLRFKAKNRFTSFTYNQSGFLIINTNKRFNKLRLSKIGNIRFKQEREIEGNIKQVIIKKKPSGWYAYIITNFKYECKNVNNNTIGVDMGVISFLTDSNGNKIDNPLYLKQSLYKLKLQHQKLSKTKKGSNNRKKVICKLLKLHEKVSNQKNDFFHKLTTNLVKNNNFIAIEKLNIKSMMNKKDNKYHNKRNIFDSSWGLFVNMLKIKVSSTESKLVFVNPRNTSKMCSKCGVIKNDLKMSNRIYNCECGLKLDRDHNAAINIFKKGWESTFVGEETIVSSMNQEANVNS